jgi:hypothetical protein
MTLRAGVRWRIERAKIAVAPGAESQIVILGIHPIDADRAFSKSSPSQKSSRLAATRANSRGMICLVRLASASACPHSAFEVAAHSLPVTGA